MASKITILFLSAILASTISVAQTKIAGPKVLLPGVGDGYMLFNPVGEKSAYLIDNCGRLINKWQSQYSAAHTIHLKPNGTLVRSNVLDPTLPGGSGGGVEILDWDSNLLWSYQYYTSIVLQHHDIAVLPNGNILILAWEAKTQAESVAAGRNPALIPDNTVWPEHIVEVRPIVPNGGEIVWEWHVWDHLVQDFDGTKSNFGIVGDHPELIDVNFTVDGKKDWIHANAIDYNPELDQIIISANFFDEMWIIDHSTTTAQASTHTGGRSNMGGDLLYRWGNPLAYRQGTLANQKMFRQHDVQWIKKGLPNEGKILFFNNGLARGYSTVEMFTTPLNANGTYALTGTAYGPTVYDRTYQTNPSTNLFSRIMGSAQMLSNGNLFICSSLQGTIWEIDPSNQILWEYKSPISSLGIVGRTYFPTGSTFTSTPIFHSVRYPRNFPAFSGRSMAPMEPIEGEPWADCTLVTGLEAEHSEMPVIYPVPSNEVVHINWKGKEIRATLVDMMGKKLFEGSAQDNLSINTTQIPSGLYLLRANDQTFKIIVRH